MDTLHDSKKITIGSWLTFSSMEVAEIMARSGFDWLTVDMEHSAITLDKAQSLIRVIELCGITPLVRVGENNHTLIKRVMDAGAHGVIVPMVNSRLEAERAVGAVKYPPIGYRGVGLARAQGYGLGFENYRKWNNSHSLVIVQIEHIKAVEDFEFIMKVEGVDGFIVGPYDLSASIGFPGKFDHSEFIQAQQRLFEVSRELDTLRGFHVVPPEPELLRQKMDEGYNFIAYSLDSLILAQSCRAMLQQVKDDKSG